MNPTFQTVVMHVSNCEMIYWLLRTRRLDTKHLREQNHVDPSVSVSTLYIEQHAPHCVVQLTGTSTLSNSSASLRLLTEARGRLLRMFIRYSMLSVPDPLGYRTGAMSTTISCSTSSGWRREVAMATFPPMLWPTRTDLPMPLSFHSCSVSLTMWSYDISLTWGLSPWFLASKIYTCEGEQGRVQSVNWGSRMEASVPSQL